MGTYRKIYRYVYMHMSLLNDWEGFMQQYLVVMSLDINFLCYYSTVKGTRVPWKEVWFLDWRKTYKIILESLEQECGVLRLQPAVLKAYSLLSAQSFLLVEHPVLENKKVYMCVHIYLIP